MKLQIMPGLLTFRVVKAYSIGVLYEDEFRKKFSDSVFIKEHINIELGKILFLNFHLGQLSAICFI